MKNYENNMYEIIYINENNNYENEYQEKNIIIHKEL